MHAVRLDEPHRRLLRGREPCVVSLQTNVSPVASYCVSYFVATRLKATVASYKQVCFKQVAQRRGITNVASDSLLPVAHPTHGVLTHGAMTL